jgi:tetratricopeptide (TPR) repeat protein
MMLDMMSRRGIGQEKHQRTNGSRSVVSLRASAEDIAARIAKAKQYKSPSEAVSASPSLLATPASTSPSAPIAAATPAQPDYAAFTKYVQGSSKAKEVEPRLRLPSGPLPPPLIASPSSADGIGITRNKPDAVPFLQRDGVEDLASLILNASVGDGSATQVASSLAGVFSQEAEKNTTGIDPSLSMEAFTVAREEKMKEKGADILLSQVDVESIVTPRRQAALDLARSTERSDNENLSELGMSLLSSQQALTPPVNPTELPSTSSPSEATSEAPQELYKPKVATWGAFPRPANISEAYGGGKNIKPGQRLESEEQERERERSFMMAMQQYREKMGLDIDPELEVEAEREYSEGMRLFESGSLREAYAYFQKALDLVPIRTAVGGKATLQKAVILDSTGESEAAKKLYKNLRGHAVAAVARKARQLSYGFEAAEFLKADTISYQAKSKDYIRYFRQIADRNRIYVASEEDKEMDEQMSRAATLIAVGMILGPFVLTASLILSKN